MNEDDDAHNRIFGGVAQVADGRRRREGRAKKAIMVTSLGFASS
jgi:hypothetical protein